MALEDLTGPDKFITHLVETNPLAADDRREGDDHIRGIKNVLNNTFPQLNAAVDLTPAELSAAKTAVQRAGDMMTGRLGHSDGTIAAPSITFTGDNSMGFYRAGATIGLAIGGVRVEELAVGATNTYLSVNPKAAGSTAVILSSGAAADANANQLIFESSAVSYSIREGLTGAATAKALNLTFPGGVNSSGSAFTIGSAAAGVSLKLAGNAAGGKDIASTAAGANRWLMRLGHGYPDDFILWRYNDAGVLQSTPALNIERLTGKAFVGGDLKACNNEMGFTNVDSPNINKLMFTNSGWRCELNLGSSVWGWFRYDNAELFQLRGDGTANKSSGAGQWGAVSDERFKNVYGAYEAGLNEILALKPKWYAYKDDPETLRVSLIAQDVQPVMPDMITVQPIERGGLRVEDGLMFDPTNIQYALINAVRTMQTQIDELRGRIIELGG